MASLLRSRSALQRASSALRARVVGVRPVPALSSIRHRRACSTRRGARAVPRRRRSGRGHRVARPRSRLFPARVAARTRSPPRPRARPARPDRVGVSRTPRVSRRMGKQSENSQRGSSFSFSSRRSEKHPASTRTRLTPFRFVFSRPRASRHIDPLLPHRTASLDRATNSAGRTATSSPSSWTASRRTCRKA